MRVILALLIAAIVILSAFGSDSYIKKRDACARQDLALAVITGFSQELMVYRIKSAKERHVERDPEFNTDPDLSTLWEILHAPGCR